MAKESQLGWMSLSHDVTGLDKFARERLLLLSDHAGAFSSSFAPAETLDTSERDDFTAWSVCPNCRVGAVHLLGDVLHTPTGRGRFHVLADPSALSLADLLADSGKTPIALPHRKVWHDEMLESIQRECRSCRHVWNQTLGWTWTEARP